MVFYFSKALEVTR